MASNKVQLDKPAPEFNLTDYIGEETSQTDFSGKKNVLLVFNRGFT